jgi:quinol monooxygenase YgiN
MEYAMTDTIMPSKQEQPPAIAAPKSARPVIVTLDMTARNAEALKQHLLTVIPVTRKAAGQRFSWSTQDPENAARFTLIQEWESLAQQQGYIAWRTQRGDLTTLLDMLEAPPRIEIREVFDR